MSKLTTGSVVLYIITGVFTVINIVGFILSITYNDFSNIYNIFSALLYVPTITIYVNIRLYNINEWYIWIEFFAGMGLINIFLILVLVIYFLHTRISSNYLELVVFALYGVHIYNLICNFIHIYLIYKIKTEHARPARDTNIEDIDI